MSITRALAVFTRKQGCLFTARGEPLSALEVLASESFLPIVALHADAKCRELMGRPLPGIELRDDPDALFGCYVEAAELTGEGDSSFRIALFTHSAISVFGIAESVRIDCEPLYEAYRDGLMSHVQNGGPMSWPLAQVSPL